MPVYLSVTEKTEIDVEKAAWEWQSKLIRLAEGKTVDEAVLEGNNTATYLGAAHRWRREGDGNVTILAKPQ